MALNLSGKRLQIDKANVHIVIAVSIAVFFLIFSLIASKALVSQMQYQAKLISKKQSAKDTLEDNIKNTDKLVESYKTFVSNQENIIGGASNGQGDRDGDNARIVLDALPSKYDFPALTTSLEKILTQPGAAIENITGTDDEVNQTSNQQSANPQPVEIPFEVVVVTNYPTVQNLLTTLQKSIRPIQIQSLILAAGEGGGVKLTIKANTYYQPEKILDIKKEVVK